MAEANDAVLTLRLGEFYEWLRTSRNGLDQEKAETTTAFMMMRSRLTQSWLMLGKRPMSLTRIFTFFGLTVVLLAVLAAGLGQFRTAIFLLATIVVAGLAIAVWNWRK